MDAMGTLWYQIYDNKVFDRGCVKMKMTTPKSYRL